MTQNYAIVADVYLSGTDDRRERERGKGGIKGKRENE